jgi:hypothetical protein
MEIGPQEYVGAGLWVCTVRDASGQSHVVSVLGQGQVIAMADRSTTWTEYEVQVDNKPLVMGEGNLLPSREEAFRVGVRYLSNLDDGDDGGVA